VEAIERRTALVLCPNLFLGLAVLALATVDAEKTVASAKTANSGNPNFKVEQRTSARQGVSSRS